MSNRNENLRLTHPPTAPQLGPDATRVLHQGLEVAHNAAAASYFQSKLIQPVWKQIIFTETTGPTVDFQWAQPWTPQSVLVVNPNQIPIWVATAGSNPVDTGVAYPPATSLRIPIGGARGYVVGINPSENLVSTQYLVHLFCYPTAD